MAIIHHVFVIVTCLVLLRAHTGSCDQIINVTSSVCVDECFSYPDMDYFQCEDAGCTRIPVDCISSTATHIDLSYNMITHVPQINLTDVIALDLSHNKIINITKGAFDDLKNLTHLNLSRNAIVELPVIATKNLKYLEVLDLSQNTISKLDDRPFFWIGTTLKRLNLSGNSLDHLEINTWSGIDALEILDLSNNKFTTIGQHYFWGLDTVQYLSLRQNQIVTIEADSFQNSLRNLLRLDLGQNQLQKFNSDMFHKGARHVFTNLQAIHLDRNQIKEIANKTFSPILSLQYLFLDENSLQAIAPGTPFPTSLKTLSLRQNTRLTRLLNGTLSDLRNLTTVDISGCHHLASIEANTFGGPASRLTSLKATSAGLETLSGDLLNWTRMSELYLGGNPWNCDCHLSWMNDSLPKNVTDDVKCAHPFSVKGASINTVDPDSLVCTVFSEHRNQIAVGMIAAVTVIFVAALGFFMYSYRKRIFRPCMTTPQKGDYQTLFNTAEDADTEAAVSIQWENGDSETTALREKSTTPTAV